jgi:hypothetical protein
MAACGRGCKPSILSFYIFSFLLDRLEEDSYLPRLRGYFFEMRSIACLIDAHFPLNRSSFLSFFDSFR